MPKHYKAQVPANDAGDPSPFPEPESSNTNAKRLSTLDEALRKLGEITLAQLTPWLEKAGRSPQALVAAWELTRDPSVEAELGEKHADNPMVCLALIGKEAGSYDPLWLSRLRLAAPDHPLPDCIAAADAARAGDLGETRAALARAMGKTGRRDFYLPERMTMLRAAANAAGTDARTIAFAPLKAFPGVSTFTPVYLGGRDLLRKVADGSIPAERAGEAAEAALALVSHAPTGPGGSYLSDRQVASIRRLALNYLPADVELGDTGQTLGQAVETDTALQTLIGSAERFQAAWQTAPTEEINSYCDEFISHGEASAIRRFLEQVEFVQRRE